LETLGKATRKWIVDQAISRGLTAVEHDPQLEIVGEEDLVAGPSWVGESVRRILARIASAADAYEQAAK
jgi:hypothetical protein